MLSVLNYFPIYALNVQGTRRRTGLPQLRHKWSQVTSAPILAGDVSPNNDVVAIAYADGKVW